MSSAGMEKEHNHFGEGKRLAKHHSLADETTGKASEYGLLPDEDDEQEWSHSVVYAHLAHALARGYTDLYYVNMDSDEFIEFHTDDERGVLNEARRGKDFFEGCERDAKLYVHKDDQAAFVRAMDRDYLKNALAGGEVFELTYRRIIAGVSFYVLMKVSRMQGDENHVVISVMDIDEQVRHRREEERIQEERIVYARLHAITGNFICVYVVNPENGTYREFSATDNYEKSFAQEKEGTDFFATVRDAAHDFNHPEDLNRFLSVFTRENVMAEVERSGIFTLGYRLLINGKYYHVQIKAAMVEEKEGRRLIVGINNIDTQVRQEEEQGRQLEKAQTQANIDALTGVKNKYAYLKAEEKLNAQIADGSKPEFAIVVLDVNDLKIVNDTAGHQAGDEYLRDACRVICNIFKRSPVFRVGGDEFAVISQGSDYDHMDELVAELDACNEEAIRTGRVVVARGMAKFEAEDRVSEVFQRADHSMYQNKAKLKERKAELRSRKTPETDG